ncbi:AAA domain-containing protein [Streptomyces chartreusis]|uniref:AAA domain-containing protein n=1 Tax=Streptomyces chartreusis TaxID=1969 RepID=UPI00386BF958|nr:AAA domain-containing protein [Streptomyces chartreusis]WTA33633.1 AAA domain-containing protein [Streptomyces chartreusis]
MDEDGEDGTLRRAEAGEVLRAYGVWLERWRRWARRERAERPLRELYEQVYHWHQKLTQQDDQLELVLAVGLLTWSEPSGETVHRHVLTHRLETTADRKTAKVTVRLAAEGALRLEDKSFLDSDDGWAAERAAALAEEIAAQGLDPLGSEVLEHLAQWQERVLQRPVAFSAEWKQPRSLEPGARLTFAPALVLRPRDRNALLGVYDRIADAIASEGSAPLGLAQLVLDISAQDRAAWSDRSLAPLFGDDPLFPGKTNERQRSVLARLQHDSGVVVQGPPGTGKTHTIANLVSALLAQGQRVLVTSARDQPLTVLRGKLPSAVRDLCVLLLSSTRQEGDSELERTINALTDRVAGTDTDRLREEIGWLAGQRDDLRGRIAMVTERVIALREAEVYRHPEVAPGYAGTLADIVERVQRERERLGWIGHLPDDTPTQRAPLTVAQAQGLLALLREGVGRPPSSAAVPPPPESLPTVVELAQTLQASRLSDDGLSARARTVRDDLAALEADHTDELAAQLAAARTALHRLALPPDPDRWDGGHWIPRAVTDRLARNNLLLWRRVSDVAGQLAAVSDAVERMGLRQVTVPDHLTVSRADALLASGQALRDHLAAGGRLRPRFASRAQKDAHDLLTSCTVDGHPPHTTDDLDAVVTYLRAHSTVTLISDRWQHVGAPLPTGPLEPRLAALTEAYGHLAHIDTFAAAREHADEFLLRHGIHIPLTSPREWNELIIAVEALAGRRAADAATAQLTAWQTALLTPRSGTTAPAAEAAAAAQAIRDQDIDRYAKELDALTAAHHRAHRRRHATQLLDALRVAHPVMADQLTDTCTDPKWDDRLAGLDEAWAWAAASAFIRHQRTPGLEQQLERELSECEGRLEEVTGNLAAAWGRMHCLQRMTQYQRSALQAYRAHMTAFGKGTGAHAGRHRAAANDAMKVAQDAVPAWVMPIAQVAETVQARRDAFDVVIVDEASQAGMDALFLLWLAPRVIVVGDDKQCSPFTSGMGRHQAIQDRLVAHLPDVPPMFRNLYNPHNNLYQLLSTFFPRVIRLEEHFRCMPEIIGWSAHTFYDDKLQPLRQYGGDRLPPLLTHFVEGAVTKGRDSRLHNPKEAEAIVDCLAELAADPAYQDKTMGVITLQGHAGQGRLLERLIQQRLAPTIRERHQIRAGSPASFQGDERHIILLSMVATNPPRIVGGQRHERQAYNVAASRAQDQLRLFYSVPPDRLKPGDMRLNLLTYMQNPPAQLADTDTLGLVPSDVRRPPFDSLFEQHVYLRLKQAGYHVIPQYPAGSKKIDLVVVGARGRLAVECDGDYYHSTPEQIRRDQQRDRELQRVGWEFWRLRESEFRYDPDEALAGLWQELDRRDIHPADFTPTQHTHPTAPLWVPLDLPVDDGLPEDESVDDATAMDPLAADNDLDSEGQS